MIYRVCYRETNETGKEVGFVETVEADKVRQFKSGAILCFLENVLVRFYSCASIETIKLVGT
jgi:hypothetical protein